MNSDVSTFRFSVLQGFVQLKAQLECFVQPILQRYGISKSGLMVLFHIAYQNQCPTLGELHRSMHLNQGNTSSLCKKMEQEGYLTRQRRKNDERMVELKLTEQGSRIIAEIEADFQRLDQILNNHPETQLQSALAGFHAFVDFITLVWDEARSQEKQPVEPK